MIEPYYMIDFSASDCMFEIRVNDIPMITMNIEGQAATKIPINQAISKSGKQEITIKVLPLHGKSSLSSATQLNYTIQLYEVFNNYFNFNKQLEGYESPKIDEEKVVPLLTDTTTFDAEIPYQLRDYWKDGQDLNHTDDLNLKLRNAYLSLGNIINEDNYDLFSKKMANREFNMATSMYLSDKASKSRLNGLINDFKNGFDTISLSKKAATIYSAYGKKVALKKPNGEPALSFINKESNEELMLDIEFYLPEGSDQFEII